VDELVKRPAAGCDRGGGYFGGVEPCSCCLHPFGKRADVPPTDAGPRLFRRTAWMRVVCAQSSDRKRVVAAYEVYEGCYGEPEGPPRQPADLLADSGRLGKGLKRLCASAHCCFLRREIDKHIGELPGIVEVPVQRDRVVEERECGLVVVVSASDVRETAQCLAQGMLHTGCAAVLDDLSCEVLGPVQIVVPERQGG
jgi:hypothetical protein